MISPAERTMRCATALLAITMLAAAAPAASRPGAEAYDILIRGGTVYDGTGGPPRRLDVGIRSGRIVAVGGVQEIPSRVVIDAAGLAVAPGFINMLSWSNVSLIVDGRSQGEIRQGVTTQILGEGTSMGPLNADMKRRALASQGGLHYDIPWTTLAGYLKHLEQRGVAQNVASFIGAATIRTHVLGRGRRAPTPAELEQMRALVHDEMAAGALGIGTALIYAPGTYASTEELIELCKVAARYQGKYTSHLRSEGPRLVEGVAELIRISREAAIPAEIHHLKASGERNWHKMDEVLAMVEAARHEGLKITANMYLYTASSTGLSSRIPSWAHDGGAGALFARLAEPETRARIAREMRGRGPMPRTLLTAFRTGELRSLIGRTLAEVARERGTDEVDTLLDLVLEDRSRVRGVFFTMSEENLRRQLTYPWVSIGSDGASMAPEGVFLDNATHPRSYGNFARLLGKYVREERILTLEEAVRRMTSLPAGNLGLEGRGLVREGMHADLVVFDPETIADRATYENPHQYATGMRHVLVNGVPVLKDGEHTGATPGRALWGPGKVR